MKEGLPRGNGAPNKQNKGRRKTQREKGGDSRNDAGVTYKVAVPKLSPVQSAGAESSHSLGLGDGWAGGTRLKVSGVLCCSRALLPNYEQNMPLDTVP